MAASRSVKRIARRVASAQRHERYLMVLGCLAVMVTLGTMLVLMQHGVAATRTELVLDCHYAGDGAHTHTEDCYDDGQLVCPLPERELHVHGDDCYADVLELTCGLEETDGHTHGKGCYDEDGELVCRLEEVAPHRHTDACWQPKLQLTCGKEEVEPHHHSDACYDEKGKLTCGLEETDGHKHGPECYEKVRELVCEREEVTEEHVHGPGCFVEVIVDDGEPEAEPEPEPVAGSEFEPEPDPAVGPAVEPEDEAEPAVESEPAVEPVPESDPAAEPETEAQSDAADASEGVSDPVVDEAAPSVDATLAASAANMPAQAFEQLFKNSAQEVLLKVRVDAPEGALPEGSSMVASWVREGDLSDKAQEAVEAAVAEKTEGRIEQQQAVDISFKDAEGKPVEPASKVTVTFTSSLMEANDQPMVVHIEDLTEAQQKAIARGKTEPNRSAEVIDKLTERELAKRDMALSDEQVAFESDSFSTYVLVVTSLHKVMEASDGKTYVVTVDAPAAAGIPQDAELEVEEIVDGYSAYGMSYGEYVSSTENALGWEAGSSTYARVFDISIVKDGEKIQPVAGSTVDVSIRLDDHSEEAQNTKVVHFAEGTSEGDIMGNVETVGSQVSFEAGSFSVYVIINHEGEETVVAPRVEFHFIGQDYTESNGSYTASPFNFVNTGGDYQTTQILKNGEALELITNPPNITIEGDDGSREEVFFYGWYVVNGTSDSAVLNESTGMYQGEIAYSWPSDGQSKIAFQQPIAISVPEGAQVGDTLTWTLGDLSGTGVMDSEGRVHVYLAPLYEDFFFVNFHMGSKEDTSGLASNIVARKLVVFGDNETRDVRIGDVVAPSPDPAHKIFVGWETVEGEAGSLVRKEYYQTVDYDNNEINSEGSNSGFYIEMSKDDGVNNQADLYPVFAEARWVRFNTGKSGNGAKYVGSAFRLTNDENMGNYFDSAFFAGTDGNDSHLSNRAGYEFEGWYAFANYDENGNITNLTNPELVAIKYVDETGVTQEVTINTTAVKVVNDDGTLAYSGAYDLNTGSGTVKLFEVVDGKMYVYKAMDDLTLHAHWVVQPTTYRVIVWKQKVTDDKNTTKTPVDLLNWLAEDTTRNPEDYPYAIKDYDYEIFYTSNPVDASAVPNLSSFTGSYVNASGSTQTVRNLNMLGQSWTGFHYSCNDAAVVGTPNPDGTTVYNVYYDRDLRRLTFQDNSSGYSYAVSTGNSTPQFAFINGEIVELTFTNGVWYAEEYGDIYVQDDTDGSYGLVDGEYVALTPVYETSQVEREVFKLTSTLAAGEQYLIVNRNSAGSGYALGHSAATVTRDSVTINAADPNVNTSWIDVDEVDSTTIWNTSGSGTYRFQNGNYYLGRTDNNALQISTGNTNNQWSWNQNRNRLSINNGYLRYNNNTFSLSTTTNSIYLYVKDVITEETATISGYTYTDGNGTTQTYQGEHRYAKEYGATGVLKEYTGTRYTRSYVNSGWHTVYVVEALYGQGIAQYFPIPGYTNGQRWTPRQNSLGWSEVMVIIDTMPEEDVTFRVSTSTATEKTMNYYVEVLPGEEADRERNGVSYSLYNSVKARYNYITSEDFLSLTGFEKNGSSPTINGNTYLTNYNDTIDFYYLRNKYNLTFDVNYPVDANLTYSQGESENLTVSNIYYQAPLNEYGSTTTDGVTNWYYGVQDDKNTAEHELVGPDHYLFGGWFEDAACTVPFNFNSTMPVGNKIVYAKWTPERFPIKIDPNGGEIDHINHTYTSNYGGQAGYDYAVFNREAIPGERVADSGYRRDQATLINANYGTVISEYAVPRNYVPISDLAAQNYDGIIYYYMNAQYRETDGSGLPSDCRNALYMTEDEIDQYYEFYRDWTQGNIDGGYITGTTVLDKDTWKALYISPQKYRIAGENEHYTFLGWYKVVDGVVDSMPYDFTNPVTEAFTLRAMWRLDGNYKLHYVPEYTMADGAVIDVEVDEWTDLPASSMTYADGAETKIYMQPTTITRNGVDVTDDSVIFLGWQLVGVDGTEDNPVYIPLEPGVYYEPDDPYVVQAANADMEGNIYFQAVYQYKDSSDRRPIVKNLVLDANTGYVNSSDSSDLPDWDYPGKDAINTEDHLLEGNPTQIEFGDIQSNAAVHLYKYSSDITTDAAGNPLEDAHQFFEHPDGYHLLGFDDGPTEGDYLATYPADSVIAITRDEERTIYAVWEPTVYLTLKNETGVGDVTVDIGSTSGEALEVVNIVTGTYERIPLTSLGDITIPDGESITLAFPKGAEKDITISGTNSLGVGKVLIWNSSIDLVEGNETTTYDTATEGEDITYAHNGDENDTHNLVTGEVANTKPFEFDESLVTNKNPLTVTFTSRDNAYALVLDDNYQGGGVQEIDYSYEQITPENGVPKSQELPSTSTRIGYEFQGWAYEPDATEADYSATSPSDAPWTITDLNATDGFFSEGTTDNGGTKVRTLYAVWKAKADRGVVYAYKSVPTPGNQTQDFDFTVAITGTYHAGNTNYTIDQRQTFQLKHGWYLKITSSNDNATASGHTTAYVQSVVQVFNADGVQQGTDVTVRWERGNVSPSTNNGFRSDLKVTVTEADATYYDTTVTRNAQTDANKIYLGTSQDVATTPLTVDTNYVYWTNTDAGGTVVYTNTRQTHDVAVKKVLHSNTSAATIFSFAASYEYEGSIVDLGTFTVQSGSTDTQALKGIPAGAVLTITELSDTDNNYLTTTSSEKGATNQSDADKTFSFLVSEADTITFDNTLKSYPVTFRLVDQDMNPTINGMFSLGSSIGSLGSDLYASATSTNPAPGVFYKSDKLWADTYTLTQTVVPTGYIGPSGPVTLEVTGNGITCSNPDVIIEEDGNGGYLVSVINRATRKVTVKKVLVDSLLTSTRQFGFAYRYTPQGETEAIAGEFTIAPVANAEAGATYELVVPLNARVTVTEKATGDYAAIRTDYETAVTSEDYANADGATERSFTVDSVASDGTIVFTNTRTIKVALKKVGLDSVTQEVVSSALGGAHFTVYGENHTTPATGIEDGRETLLVDRVSTAASGIIFSGILPGGTYFIHETKAPDGYSLMLDDLTLTIGEGAGNTGVSVTKDGETTSITPDGDGVYIVELPNYCGYELPSAGGIGTAGLYLLGATMVAAGAFVLLRRGARASEV